MIEFACSQCGREVRVPQKYAGKKGRCPHCRAVEAIPATPAPPPASVASAAPPAALPVAPPAALPVAPPEAPPAALPVAEPPPSVALEVRRALPIFTLVLGCSGVVFPPLGLAAVVMGIYILVTRRPGTRMAAVGLVLGLVLPVLPSYFLYQRFGHHREIDRHGLCTANLKSIGQAIATYRSDHRARPPRLHKFGDPAQPLSGATQSDQLWGPKGARAAPAIGTAAVQNFWLLLEEWLIPQTKFTCPSDEGHLARDATKKWGWTSRRQVSYGLHYPYDGPSARRRNPAAWTEHLDGGVAIVADQNPASLHDKARGSGVSAIEPVVAPSNHADGGQAVLRADGSASFHSDLDPVSNRPRNSYCGKDGDDIYEAGGGDIPAKHVRNIDGKDVAIPGNLDTYIVPTRDKP